MNWFTPEWLLALALTLFVVDLINGVDGILSWLGVGVVAAWATWRIDAPVKWWVLVYIGAFLVSGLVWCLLFRGLIGQPIRRLMQKGAPEERLAAIKGAKGILRVIDGKVMFRWNGDELWPVANPPAAASDGQEVVADGIRDGQVVIK